MRLPVRLYNTLSRSLCQLSVAPEKPVRVYCCGPTVYNFQHIGNLRTYIFEDLLVRTLRACGYEVEHVMNITDVGHLVSDADEGEDKMSVAMKREHKSSLEIANFYTEAFFEDCRKLGIVRPNVVCKATEHIAEMIDLIARLEANGAAYLAGGNVYFDITKAPHYGELARLDLSKLAAGARIEVDNNKRNPHDFALWFTKSKFENQELQWDSPWGRGYPGWHIECSAMAIKYLGDHFEIHCGGIDHVPVHHTNEIAQSEAATGTTPWVSIWMHGEFLVNEKSEKMAKSSGGFICVKDLEDRGIDPLAYRFLCLSTHYRKQLMFSWDALAGAAQGLSKLRGVVLALKGEVGEATLEETPNLSGEFIEAFTNDLNAPRALAAVWSVVNESSLTPGEKLNSLFAFDSILGLGIKSWDSPTDSRPLPPAVTELIEQRNRARAARDFAASDRIRKELEELGYSVKDTPRGTEVALRS